MSQWPFDNYVKLHSLKIMSILYSGLKREPGSFHQFYAIVSILTVLNVCSWLVYTPLKLHTLLNSLTAIIRFCSICLCWNRQHWKFPLRYWPTRLSCSLSSTTGPLLWRTLWLQIGPSVYTTHSLVLNRHYQHWPCPLAQSLSGRAGGTQTVCAGR